MPSRARRQAKPITSPDPRAGEQGAPFGRGPLCRGRGRRRCPQLDLGSPSVAVGALGTLACEWSAAVAGDRGLTRWVMRAEGRPLEKPGPHCGGYTAAVTIGRKNALVEPPGSAQPSVPTRTTTILR